MPDSLHAVGYPDEWRFESEDVIHATRRARREQLTKGFSWERRGALVRMSLMPFETALRPSGSFATARSVEMPERDTEGTAWRRKPSGDMIAATDSR